ncbi:semaphorin-7A-like [Heptranchias perlo]|uniref:semaphorin-7A-like n=1 Tax=Heptranchias perlo TaxID=212740 RepID=UPI00355A1661
MLFEAAGGSASDRSVSQSRFTMFEISFFLCLFLGCASTRFSPRLKLDLRDEIKDRVIFMSSEEYMTTLHEGNTVYVGGKAILYQINFEQTPPTVKIRVPDDNEAIEQCKKSKSDYCENFIMVLQKFNTSHILLCGTNARTPRCWLLFRNELSPFLDENRGPLGHGVCPFTPKQSVTSLVVGERLYSTAPLYSNGFGVDLRGFRSEGENSWLHSLDEWMKDPKFVGMSPMDDLVYIFFREKNLPENPDIDPWISRIARVCKDDRGGSRSFLLHKWTTFLKARLLCNVPSDNVHFNRIEDVFIDRSTTESEVRVYGIFSSNWNATAICVYSMKDISDVFRTSPFKGLTDGTPEPRPGTCVNDTQLLPDKVLKVLRDYPEMEKQIHPIREVPLMIKNELHFKKIVVDYVHGFRGTVSRVLFLAMGDGKIQKVLDTSQSAFTISELEVLKEPGPILSMSLDSKTKHLYVTSAKEIVRFPLAQCDKYNKSCETCVMARDPYCAWNPGKRKCVPSTPDFRNLIQDLENGEIDKCFEGKVAHLRSSQRDRDHKVLTLHLHGKGVPMYLSCPKQSYHANYSWTFNHHEVLECSSNEDDCLLLINNLSKDCAGFYECHSVEGGHEQLLTSYLIQDNSGSSVYLSRYSVAFCSVLMTVAALILQ